MAKPPLHVPLSEFEPPADLLEEEFLAVYENEVEKALAHLNGADLRGSDVLRAAAIVGNLALCKHACEIWGRRVRDINGLLEQTNGSCRRYLADKCITESMIEIEEFD